MERTESEGFNQSTGGEQSGFGERELGSSGAGGLEASGSTSGNTNFDETSSGGIGGRLKSVGSSVKDKAAGLPGLLADGLEAGAKALRQRQPAVAGADGSAVTVSSDSSIGQVTDTIASGMQSSADWLRDADVEKLKAGVETQVKEHPARSLLIALGAGYLIGKVLRR